MAIYRAYSVDSGLVSIGGTSATTLLSIVTTSTNDCNLVKFKVSVEGVSSPAPPSNGSVFFSLNKVTGTAAGTSVTPQPLTASTLAANTVFKTAPTALTQGVEYWAQPVPFTAGAFATDDFENTGLETNIAASATYAVYFIAPSGAGSGCSARVVLWFAE